MNDLQVPLNKKVVANYSGTEGGLVALSGSANTYLYNQFASGGIADFLADGIDGQSIQMRMIHSSGRMILQNGTAHNDFRDIVGARLALNSNTDGFLMPRMTTAQRDAMAYISRVDVGGSGHGYTTATVVASGGNGSGFAATANLAGDGVNTITITNPGTGYTIPPTVTITGDGTGAYATVIPVLVEGLQIYNLDTHKINTYNGTNWKQATETDA